MAMRKTEFVRFLILTLVVAMCLPLIGCGLFEYEITTAPETTKTPDDETPKAQSTAQTAPLMTYVPNTISRSSSNPGNDSKEADPDKTARPTETAKPAETIRVPDSTVDFDTTVDTSDIPIPTDPGHNHYPLPE